MPRINLRTLWFEDIGFVNQPTIDTPFGRLSMRQLVGIGLFALIAWITFQALGFVGDIVLRVIPAAAIMVLGVVIFTWRVKTVPPERTILLAMGIGRKHVKRSAAKAAKPKKGGKAPVPAPAPAARIVKAQATVGEPCKIAGILRDPRLGRPLSNRSFEVFADGAPLYKGVTDEQGGFEVVYVPQHAGSVRIEVRPEGVVGAEQSIEITVRGAPAEVG